MGHYKRPHIGSSLEWTNGQKKRAMHIVEPKWTEKNRALCAGAKRPHTDIRPKGRIVEYGRKQYKKRALQKCSRKGRKKRAK